jgi:pilus assembly protein CpaF
MSNTIEVDLESSEMSFSECLLKVQDYIAARLAESRQTSGFTEKNRTKADDDDMKRRYINDFILDKRPKVQGYTNEKGELQLKRLYKVLDDITTGYDVISDAMADPTITEIQINAYDSIFMENKGRFIPLVDKSTGEIVKFRDVKSCLAFINNLLQSAGDQLDYDSVKVLGNSITPEGYRVAAIGPFAMAARKGRNALLEKSPACVIRKFSDNVITSQQIINNFTQSDQIAYFNSILGNCHATVIVGGSTGSGKTVNLQIIVDNIDGEIRVISMEKDSELRICKFDAEGRPLNNVIQLEYIQEDPQTKYVRTQNTAENLFNQLLRFTPSTIILGECRSSKEISLLLTGINAGHNVMCTLHTDSASAAIERITQAQMLTSPGATKVDVMQTVCSAVDIVVIPRRMADGSRKIVEVSEIMGVEMREGIAVPKVNQLYVFKQTGYYPQVVYDDGTPEGKIDHNGKVFGEHWQVGELSDETYERWSKGGMQPEIMEFLTRRLERDENGKKVPARCTYNGYLSPYSVPCVDSNKQLQRLPVVDWNAILSTKAGE